MQDSSIRYLTPTHTAKYLGVSRAFFYAHLKNNPSFPQPLLLTAKKSVFDRLQVDKWLEQNQEQIKSDTGV